MRGPTGPKGTSGGRGPTGPKGATGARGPTGPAGTENISLTLVDESLLVQDILLTGGGAATIQAMLTWFVQNGNFLEPIDPLANPSMLDQLFAYELNKGPGAGNYVYNVVATYFRTKAAAPLVERPQPPPRPRASAAAGAAIPRRYWAVEAAFALSKGGKQSALYEILEFMFYPR